MGLPVFISLLWLALPIPGMVARALFGLAPRWKATFLYLSVAASLGLLSVYGPLSFSGGLSDPFTDVPGPGTHPTPGNMLVEFTLLHIYGAFCVLHAIIALLDPEPRARLATIQFWILHLSLQVGVVANIKFVEALKSLATPPTAWQSFWYQMISVAQIVTVTAMVLLALLFLRALVSRLRNRKSPPSA
jgi:hypothetical protein